CAGNTTLILSQNDSSPHPLLPPRTFALADGDTMISSDDSLVFRRTIGEMARRRSGSRRERMKVFITGVAGYAGYYAASRLAAAGHEVTGLVRHPDQPRLNTLRIQEVRLVTGDVGEVASYRGELERSDAVIHTMLDKRKPQETDRALFAAL